MKILLIDSTKEQLWIAVAQKSNGNITIISEQFCNIMRAHDKNLNKLVRKVLDDTETGFSALAAFAVVTGPGSWTGCRVGVIAVKAYGIAHPTVKIIALTSAESNQTLVNTAFQRYEKKEFTTTQNLMPFYDGEFKVTLKKN